MHSPIICALDTTDLPRAKAMAGELLPHLGLVKLGLEFFVAHGAAGVHQVMESAGVQGQDGTYPLFLDLKFHDIPNTVAGAVRAAVGTRCRMLTIHAGGGRSMAAAAVAAAHEAADALSIPTPLVLAVTLLTSLDAAEVAEVGYGDAIPDQVLRLADVALSAGVPGLVCSPHEIEPIRKRFGDAPVLVVPGIRPAGSVADDQKRTMTPKQALDLGANYLVIGRPITGAADPVNAAKTII